MHHYFLYLHGYNDSPDCEQSIHIKHWLATNYPTCSYDFPQLPPKPEAQIQQTEQLINNNQADMCIIIANSLGGYIAHIVKQKHPEKINRVVLINPVINLAKIVQERDYDRETVNDANYLMQQYPHTMHDMNSYLLLLQEDDISVSPIDAINKFSKATLHISKGQGHQYNQLDFDLIKCFIDSHH